MNTYYITKGADFKTSIEKQETELTPEMIARLVFCSLVGSRKLLNIMTDDSVLISDVHLFYVMGNCF